LLLRRVAGPLLVSRTDIVTAMSKLGEMKGCADVEQSTQAAG
jgi:hypothetical protein